MRDVALARDRRTRWNFSVRADGMWFWTAMSPRGPRFSQTSFPTLADCQLHARQHGYIGGTEALERRAQPTTDVLQVEGVGGARSGSS
jgi:hypothetical protein